MNQVLWMMLVASFFIGLQSRSVSVYFHHREKYEVKDEPEKTIIELPDDVIDLLDVKETTTLDFLEHQLDQITNSKTTKQRQPPKKEKTLSHIANNSANERDSSSDVAKNNVSEPDTSYSSDIAINNNSDTGNSNPRTRDSGNVFNSSSDIANNNSGDRIFNDLSNATAEADGENLDKLVDESNKVFDESNSADESNKTFDESNSADESNKAFDGSNNKAFDESNNAVADDVDDDEEEENSDDRDINDDLDELGDYEDIQNEDQEIDHGSNIRYFRSRRETGYEQWRHSLPGHQVKQAHEEDIEWEEVTDKDLAKAKYGEFVRTVKYVGMTLLSVMCFVFIGYCFIRDPVAFVFAFGTGCPCCIICCPCIRKFTDKYLNVKKIIRDSMNRYMPGVILQEDGTFDTYEPTGEELAIMEEIINEIMD